MRKLCRTFMKQTKDLGLAVRQHPQHYCHVDVLVRKSWNCSGSVFPTVRTPQLGCVGARLTSAKSLTSRSGGGWLDDSRLDVMNDATSVPWSRGSHSCAPANGNSQQDKKQERKRENNCTEKVVSPRLSHHLLPCSCMSHVWHVGFRQFFSRPSSHLSSL